MTIWWEPSLWQCDPALKNTGYALVIWQWSWINLIILFMTWTISRSRWLVNSIITSFIGKKNISVATLCELYLKKKGKSIPDILIKYQSWLKLSCRLVVNLYYLISLEQPPPFTLWARSPRRTEENWGQAFTSNGIKGENIHIRPL